MRARARARARVCVYNRSRARRNRVIASTCIYIYICVCVCVRVCTHSRVTLGTLFRNKPRRRYLLPQRSPIIRENEDGRG